MPAAVLRGPGRLDVTEVPVPEPGAGDVVVAVDHCGVCGTDLHFVLEGWGAPGMIPGHEWTGVVAAVGAGVDAWKPGDAVVGGPPSACGACRHCAAGRPSLCVEHGTPGIDPWQGAWAQFIRVAGSEVVARPAGMPSRHAALAEPLAVALHGITRSGAVAGQRVLVSGAGPIGALTIAALRALGVDDVRCVEPGTRRQELAAAVGATAVLVPDDLDVPSVAEPSRVVADAVDVVIECSGKARAMEAGLGQLERGGTMVVVGSGMEPPRFDPNRIVLNEPVITGANTYDADGFDRALALLGSGSLPLDALLEPDDVPLTGVLGAMHELADGRRAGKVLVKP